MGSFSGLGIVLSFVFGLILIGVVGELLYLLWWKKRYVVYPNTNTIGDGEVGGKVRRFGLFWRKPTSVLAQELTNHQEYEDLEMGTGKNSGSKGGRNSDENVEIELRRVHNLGGPPRFLFTIKEESKEDLESEGVKSRTRSLSEVFPLDETPFLTPLASPSFKTTFDYSYTSLGFNPLFESMSEEEINKLRSSPPPKLKFLRDAEDKLIKRMLLEQQIHS